jgi:hypothetical protein
MNAALHKFDFDAKIAVFYSPFYGSAVYMNAPNSLESLCILDQKAGGVMDLHDFTPLSG